MGRTEAASLFALAFGFPLGGSCVDDDAAAASFFVLVGAAGLSASSKTGVVLVEINEILTARSLQSFLFPTGDITFDHVDQEFIGPFWMPCIESPVPTDVKMHELRILRNNVSRKEFREGRSSCFMLYTMSNHLL